MFTFRDFFQNQAHLSSTKADTSRILQRMNAYIHRKRSSFYPLSYVFAKPIIARFYVVV